MARWLPLLFVWLTASAPALGVELRIKGADVARALEQSLTGTAVHLDYDVVGSDGKSIPRSFVELPAALGMQRMIFSVPEQPVDLGGFGRALYRVRDVNLDHLSVAATPHDYVLSLFFEDEGYELVAAPSGSSLGNVAPDVQMDRMRLDLHLRPKQGKAEIERGSVTFEADAKPAGLDSRVPGASALLDDVTGYKQRVKALLEAEATKTLASKDVLAALNARLQQELSARAGENAGALRFDGTDLVLDTAPGRAQKVVPAKASAKKRGR